VIGPGGELELPAHLAAAELDHQIPRSRGGGRGPNLVLACRPCNGAKGSMTVEEYRGELGNYRGGEVVFSGEAA
jgi:5-methylcytosine-specific restriction endonuclease McrA